MRLYTSTRRQKSKGEVSLESMTTSHSLGVCSSSETITVPLLPISPVSVPASFHSAKRMRSKPITRGRESLALWLLLRGLALYRSVTLPY
jgi:hypothetical protein